MEVAPAPVPSGLTAIAQENSQVRLVTVTGRFVDNRVRFKLIFTFVICGKLLGDLAC